MLSTITSLVSILALSARVHAQISTFRGTIEGAIHQCEATGIFFFESGGARPLDVLFLPSANIPNSLRVASQTTLNDALQYKPLLALSGITTPDASQYDFTMQIATGEVVEIFAFLPDGTGKALNLTRTIMTPLPSASACLTNVPTTIPGAGVTTSASVATSTATAKTTAKPSSSTSNKASSTPTPTATSSSSSSSSTASSTSTSKPSSGTRQSQSGGFMLWASGVICVIAAVGGTFIVAA